MNESWNSTDCCRTCATNTKHLENLYEVNGSGKTLADKLKECLSFSFYEFELRPRSICSTCVKKLHAAHEFYQLIKRSDEKFKKSVASEFVCKTETNEANGDRLKDLKPLLLISSNTKPIRPQPMVKVKETKRENISGNALNVATFDSKPSPSFMDELERRWQKKFGLQTKPTKKRAATIKRRRLSSYKTSDKKIASEFQCYDCKSTFPSMERLKTHSREFHHTTIECRICSKEFTRHAYDQHLCDGGDEMQCQYCEEKFQSTVMLVKHINRQHKNHHNYKCYDCARAFPTKALLEIHKPTHNLEEPKFVCDICGNRYRTRYQIKEHIETTHTDKRCK